MARRNVAPALNAVLAWPPPYAKTGINAALVSIQARRELRALKAVARAAERLHDHRLSGPNLQCEVCAALARLHRKERARR